MSWVQDFYARQAAWSGLYRGAPTEWHAAQARRLVDLAVPPPARVLELGAGGGQSALCAARLGYAVTALELVPEAAENARMLAQEAPLTVVEGSFYDVALAERFAVVCCWDGFGVGEDAEQRRLLGRIAADWLAPGGCALIDVYAPWFAAASVGRGGEIAPGVRRVYGFDAEGCRWLDTWSRGDEAVTQSLRCYSPADLRLLLSGTGLRLEAVVPLGEGPLEAAMGYTARLVAAAG